MNIPIFAPRLAMWWRYAWDQRERRGTAKATIQTFIEGKSLSSDEVTAIMAQINA
jgi:hypothetical protein